MKLKLYSFREVLLMAIITFFRFVSSPFLNIHKQPAWHWEAGMNRQKADTSSFIPELLQVFAHIAVLLNITLLTINM